MITSNQNSITVTCASETLKIEAWGRGLRVRTVPYGKIIENAWALEAVEAKEVTTEIADTEMCSSACDVAMETCSSQSHDACGNSLPSVKKSPINQRFLRFWKKNRCVFLFPQSDDITGGLPQGIGFGE